MSKWENLVKARKEALADLFENAFVRGRLSGKKREDCENPYKGSNITFAYGNELVSVCMGKNGSLRVHEFHKTKNTKLGNEVKSLLLKAGLNIEQVGR